MNKPRSYATFKDGHEEDIFYFKKYGENGIFFATESGVYRYNEAVVPIGVCGLSKSCKFFKLAPSLRGDVLCFNVASDIDTITIDDRIPYKFKIGANGTYIFGEVLASPDACDEDIKDLIVDELSIEIRKKG